MDLHFHVADVFWIVAMVFAMLRVVVVAMRTLCEPLSFPPSSGLLEVIGDAVRKAGPVHL